MNGQLYQDIIHGRVVHKSSEELKAEADKKLKQPKQPLDDDDLRLVWLTNPVTVDFLSRLGKIYVESSESCMLAATRWQKDTTDYHVLAAINATTCKTVERIVTLAKSGESKLIINPNGKDQ